MKPSKLKNGDVIGIVAPSYPILSKESYEKGKDELLRMGFRIKESKNINQKIGWSAGTPKERANDINSMFADKEVKAIIAQNGGNSAFRILEYLDYKLIKKNPKPFIGFSDITNIHSALYTKTGLIGFHMDLLSYNLGWLWQDLLKDNIETSRNLFMNILTLNKPLGKIKPVSKWECWKSGKANGILFGGNLGLMNYLIGSEYFPKKEKLKGAILFWEIDNVQMYRIEAILTQLKYAGIFEIISGMIIGKLVDLKELSDLCLKNPSVKDLILSILKDYNFPILANVDFGHKCVNIPMPIGIKVKINAENLELEFLESAVK